MVHKPPEVFCRDGDALNKNKSHRSGQHTDVKVRAGKTA